MLQTDTLLQDLNLQNNMNSNLFKPSFLKELCQEVFMRPSKSFGQNYLVSQDIVERIVEAGDISKYDIIIEVGPGFGVLTFFLAEKASNVISFEIERTLESYWEEHKPNNVEIVWGDALKQLQTIEYPDSYKVIANLPYQITSKLLRMFLEQDPQPERIVVMVQKEVAERIVAKPGDMSLLAVSVQYYGEPRIVQKVPKGNFWPQPKVDSAILAITNIQRKEHTEDFFRIVKAAFSQKRKQAWKNISKGLGIEKERVKEVLQEVVGNEKVRAEELSVEQWELVRERLFSG